MAGIIDRIVAFATSLVPSRGRVAPPSPGRKDAEGALKDRIVVGYRPTLPGVGFWGETSDTPNLGRMLADVEAMVAHPRVSHSLDYYKAGIANAVFAIEDASSPQAGQFALSEANRFWSRHRRAAQRSYEFGRGGGELIYSDDEGPLRLVSLEPFMGLDCLPLLTNNCFVGVRVMGSNMGKNHRDLWGARPGLPAKGWWHAHDRRYSRWYGVPRLYPAWRPWRRLAGRDGAEDIVDGGVYRFAFAPPIGRYPPDDNNPDPSELAGGIVYSNRDKMRELLENIKEGGVAALSSLQEDGHYRWDLIFPEGSLDVSGLMAYTDNLEKAISLGCGVPPELIEASEVGSGYSGRAIPLEAFYVGQQGHAEDLLQSWYVQIGLPLLLWNFGPGSWCRLKVEDLLQTRMKASKAAEGGAGQGQPQPGTPGAPPNPVAALGQGSRQQGPARFSTAFDEGKHPRADDGKFGKGSGAKKAVAKEGALAKPGEAKTNNKEGAKDPAAGRPSRPEERHKDEEGKAPKPPAKEFKQPPPKIGKKGEGMKERPKGDASQTRIGDLGEDLATKLGFRSILPPGQRSHKAGENEEKGSTIDLEYDHSGRGYELKLCNTTATEYRLKAKAKEKAGKEKYASIHKLEAHVLVGVRDVETGEIHFYAGREPGLIGAEVSSKNYDYIGSVKP